MTRAAPLLARGISVTDDILGGAGDASGAILTLGKIGSTSIGSLRGGNGTSSGRISATGDLGPLTFTGDLVGGAGPTSGQVLVGGALAKLTIQGSLLGGAGSDAGSVHSTGPVGPVTIKGSIIGGVGADSAKIITSALLQGITISGSLIGGKGGHSGYIDALGIGPIKIGGDVAGGDGMSSAYIDGRHDAISSLTVGGSWLGGNGSNSGFIYTSGGLGPTRIAGDIRGGFGSGSGQIDVEGLQSIRIGGSMIGGSGSYSGFIYSDGNIGPVTIGGDLQGGSGQNSGQIEGAQQYITSIKIGGSIIGGPATGSGGIDARNQDIGAITIGGGIFGGNATGSDSVTLTGFIHGGHIDSIKLGRSIIAGMDTSTGYLRYSGAITADEDIGPITVKGSLIGNETNPVVILASGTGLAGGMDVAIGSLSVSGRVEHALVLAGYDFSYSSLGTPADGNAQIGKVSAGSWIASTIAAGIDPGVDLLFGTADDQIIGSIPDSIAQIASITVAGPVIGSGVPGDHFGFVSAKIGSFKTAGSLFPLLAAPIPKDVLELSVTTADMTVREV